MNGLDILLLLLIACAAALALWKIHTDRRKGKGCSSCGESCGGCGMNCDRRKEDARS